MISAATRSVASDLSLSQLFDQPTAMRGMPSHGRCLTCLQARDGSIVFFLQWVLHVNTYDTCVEIKARSCCSIG